MEKYAGYTREAIAVGTDMSWAFEEEGGESGDLGKYYSRGYDEIPDEDERDDYFGKNVVWYAASGKNLCRIKPEYVVATEGNIFDYSKMRAFAKLMRGEDRPVLPAPLGDVRYVTLMDVEETNRSPEDYALEEPWTTGEDDVDEYLKDKEEWLNDNWEQYLDEVGLEMPEGLDWRDNNYDEFEEQAQKVIREYMDNWAKELEKEGSGDLGQVYVSLRDGNHRAFAAKEVGERFIWVLPTDYSTPEAVAEVED